MENYNTDENIFLMLGVLKEQNKLLTRSMAIEWHKKFLENQ